MHDVGRNVWFLGVTSLLTDLSSEMVTAVLPIYALYFLRMSPSAFGIVDGLQQGGASLVREGENRYHAIFATDGPALFVSASSLGSALVALGDASATEDG